jgi:hypothetical protein
MTLRIAGSASKPKSRSGRAQVEEVQRVRLEELAVVHQPAHLLAVGVSFSPPTMRSIAFAAPGGG